MEVSNTTHLRFLGDYLFDQAPVRLLLVGRLPEALLHRTAAGVEVLTLATLAEAEARVGPRARSDVPETSTGNTHGTDATTNVPDTLVMQLSADSHAHVQETLGRAVRCFPHRVLVHIEADASATPLTDDVFFALGFRRLDVLADNTHSDSMVRWFEYRLSEYKSSPDWLNARFWANPERFDMDDDYEVDEEE